MPQDLLIRFEWRRQLDGCRAFALDTSGRTIATATLELGPGFGGDASRVGKEAIEQVLRNVLASLVKQRG